MFNNFTSHSFASLYRAGVAVTLCLAATFAMQAADTKYVLPSSSVPGNYSEVASSVGVADISITIPGGGMIGIEKINRTGTIEVSFNSEPLMSLSIADESKVSLSATDPNELIIHTGLLNTPGLYTVSIPAGMVEMGQETGVLGGDSGGGDEETEPVTTLNAAWELSFTIVEMPDFAVSPTVGMCEPSDLETITLTFESGTSVAAGNAIVPIALYKYDTMTASSTRVTEYKASYNGSVVTLKAATPDAIATLTGSINREWYYITIPKNALKFSYSGKTSYNPALRFEKYDVRTVGADGFSISPYPVDGLIPSDVREFIVSYPSNVSLDGRLTLGYAGAYLKQTGNTADSRLAYTGYNFGTLKVTAIDTAARTITLTMADPTSALAYDNNPERMETGYYCVSFNTRVFLNMSSLTFPGYGVIGKDGCMFSDVYVIADGKSQTDLNLTEGQSFSGLEIYYPFKMIHSSTPKDITVTLNGEQVGSLNSSAISLPSTGDKYMRIDFGKVFSASGDYEVNIPAGTFLQTSYGEYFNEEQTLKVHVGGTVGIDSINEEDSETETVYFTLDGRIADANALQPGLYIVRKGKKATKVLVK